MSENLDGKEIALIDVLDHVNQNQREIARKTGLSLGMTNVLLKKLITRGYVKVINLNGRTLKYILTPQGMHEKLKKSYNFVLASVRQVYTLRESVLTIVEDRDPEKTQVVLWGQNEVASMVQEIVQDLGFDAPMIADLKDVSRETSRQALMIRCDYELGLPENGQAAAWQIVDFYNK